MRTDRHCCVRPLTTATVTLFIAILAGPQAAEIAPERIEPGLAAEDPPVGTFSERTVVAALEVDRDRVRLLGYTRKERPFARPLALSEPRGFTDARRVQFEVALVGTEQRRYTQRADVGPLCLFHGPGAEPHIQGDTIAVHRDSFLVELPDLDGFESLEIAYYENGPSGVERRALGLERLDGARFVPPVALPGTEARRHVSGSVGTGNPPSSAASNVLWPEDFADPDIYRVYGDESAAAERINVTLVPDGYTYAEKGVMEAHADAMVAKLRATVPFTEHDPFMNYTLVYAYSPESGTDQCDCSIVVETAMGTRFPEAVSSCGSSANRCLFYGGGCDASGTTNIALAELRAPVHDKTIVLVNTTRYGGCGGTRAVYSAANGSAAEIAVHELGHTLGGLADEYESTGGCGSFAGEVNTSTNGVDGAWPEWIADLGAPHEGAQYYTECIYRPKANCEMRSLGQLFCPVCNQHWSQVTFGHPRVAPTAPIRSRTPAESDLVAYVGVPRPFLVQTRLSEGAVDLFEWTVDGPGYPGPTFVSDDPTSYSHVFDSEGDYTVVYKVVADSNFVKPQKNDANQQRATWRVEVVTLLPPQEVSSPGSVSPLLFSDKALLTWEDSSAAGSFTYNLYQGAVADLAVGSYGSCLHPDLAQPTTSDARTPPAGTAWFYLVSGVNPAGESSLGQDSSGATRPNSAPCQLQ